MVDIWLVSVAPVSRILTVVDIWLVSVALYLGYYSGRYLASKCSPCI